MAFNVSMRLPHLPLRMKAHCARSLYLAEKCATVKGLIVNYPGLKSHPQYELWKKYTIDLIGY
jgi:methionine-gamma-lyase